MITSAKTILNKKKKQTERTLGKMVKAKLYRQIDKSHKEAYTYTLTKREKRKKNIYIYIYI